MRFQICHQMKVLLVLLVLLELAHPTTNQLTLTHLNIWFDIDMIVINVLMFCVLSSWSLFRRQRHYITLLPINIHWQGFIERVVLPAWVLILSHLIKIEENVSMLLIWEDIFFSLTWSFSYFSLALSISAYASSFSFCNLKNID